jgi:hypothetical protein
MELPMVFFEGYTDEMKRVIFLRIFFVSKSVGNNIFLLPIDKKLSMKDSPMENFRR